MVVKKFVPRNTTKKNVTKKNITKINAYNNATKNGTVKKIITKFVMKKTMEKTKLSIVKDYVCSRDGALRIVELLIALVIQGLLINYYGVMADEYFGGFLVAMCVMVYVLMIIISLFLHCRGTDCPLEFWFCASGALAHIAFCCCMTYYTLRLGPNWPYYLPVSILSGILSIIFIIDSRGQKGKMMLLYTVVK